MTTHKKLLQLFFLMLSFTLVSQEIFRSNTEYIKIDNNRISFTTTYKNTFQEWFYMKDEETNKFTLGIDEYLPKTLLLKEGYQKIANVVKPVSIRKFKDKIINKDLCFFDEATIYISISKTGFAKLVFFSNSHNGYKKEIAIAYIVYLNDKYPILSFEGEHSNSGYLYIDKNGILKGKFGNNVFDDSRVILEEEKRKIKNKVDRLVNNKLFSIKNNQVYNVLFNKPILKKAYDTIYTEKNRFNSFVVAKKGNRIVLFDDIFNKIDLKNLRAVYQIPNTYNHSVLLGNKVRLLDDKGKIVTKINQEPIVLCDYQPYLATISEEKKSFKIQYKSDEKQFLYNVHKNIDSITFVDKTKQISFTEDEKPINHHLVITYKNGKQGVSKITTDKQIQQIAPPIYDTIYATSLYKPVLYEKNGLKGYLFINQHPKYTTITKFINGFARFTLPNNKKGWLKITGQEFLDK